MGDPARGYTNTHPPFQVGNQVARTHGVWARHVVLLARQQIERAVRECSVIWKPEKRPPLVLCSVECFETADQCRPPPYRISGSRFHAAFRLHGQCNGPTQRGAVTWARQEGRSHGQRLPNACIGGPAWATGHRLAHR
jgi:hypothetical protein